MTAATRPLGIGQVRGAQVHRPPAVAPVVVTIESASVSALEPGHPRWPYYTLILDQQDRGRYSIRTIGRMYLDDAGNLGFASGSIRGTREWQRRHLFTWDEAVRRATGYAATMTRDGVTAGQLLAEEKAAGRA